MEFYLNPLNFFLHRIHSNLQDGKRGGGAFSFLFLTLGGKLGNPTLVLHSSSGGTYLDWSSCSQFAYLEREVENIEYFSIGYKGPHSTVGVYVHTRTYMY